MLLQIMLILMNIKSLFLNFLMIQGDVLTGASPLVI